MIPKLANLRTRRAEDGFTMIELLVVVIIIAILAAIAIPVYILMQRQAVDSTVKSDVKQTALAVAKWRVNDGDAAGDNNANVAFANTNEYKAAGGKVQVSPDVILGVKGTEDGNFTVCGYSKKSLTMQTPESSWYYASDGAKIGNTTTVGTGVCDGAVDADGNDLSYTGVAPKITTVQGDLPDGKVGTPYSYQMTATGNPKPSWTISGVPGLQVSANGLLSGTPTAEGTATLTVTVKNGSGTDTKTFTFTIAPQYVTPQITDTDPNYFGQAIIDQNYTYKFIHEKSMGNVIDYSKFRCHMTSGTLPYGMGGFGAVNGVIGSSSTDACDLAGTPSGYINGPENYTFTVRLYNVQKPSLYDERTYTLVLHTYPRYAAANKSDTVVMSAGTAFSGYSAAVNYKDTNSTTSYQIAVGSYPTGASQTTFAVTSAGAITGTPTFAGVYTFSVVASNGYGTDLKTYSVTVNAASGVNGTYTLSDFENASAWNGTTTNGWTVNYATAPSSLQFYSAAAAYRDTTYKYGGTASMFAPSQSSNGSTGDYANTRVNLSGLTIGKKYTISGYFSVKPLSGNTTAAVGIVASGYSGFSDCTKNDAYTAGVKAVKGSWGSFTSLACTASSTSPVFNLRTDAYIGGYTSNGVSYDNIVLRQQ